MDVFGGVIRIQDNVSGVLRGAAVQSRSFQRDVARARQQLVQLDRTRIREREIRIRHSAAMRNIRNVRRALDPLRDRAVNITARVQHAVGKIKSVFSHLKKIKDSKVVRFVAKGVKAFSAAVAKLGLAAGAAGFAAITAAGTLALKSAVSFEKGMANVGTLLEGDVKSKLQSMGESLKTISKDTGVSLDNLSGGLYEVVSAFGESADSTKQLEVAAKSAKAGNAETAEAVKMLSAVTKGYGDTSAEAVSKAADLAFETIKLGQTSFSELASSMGSVIPLASSMKVSQEELFGAMSTLTGVTGNTAEVTTQLSATLNGFLQPSEEMSAVLQKMGYASGAAALEHEGLGQVLVKLKDAVGGDEVAFASLFSSVRAKTAVLALAGSQAENMAMKTDAMTKAAGAADRAFEQQTRSVAAMAGKIKNYGTVMLTSIGEKALPVIADALGKVMDAMPALEDTMGQIFGAVGPVVASLGEIFSGAASSMGVSFESVTPVIVGAITEIGNIVAAIAPIVVGAITEAKEVITTMAPIVSGILQGVGTVVEAVFPAIASVVSMIGEKIGAVFTMLGSHSQLFQSIVETMGPAVSSVITTMGAVIGPVFDLIISALDLLLSAFERVFPAIKAVVQTVWGIIRPIFEAIGKGVSLIGGAVKGIAGFISGKGGGKPGANANGTSYWKGGYTMVGEHGPELVSLPTGSKVLSNSSTQKNLGGDAVSINISSLVVREEADVQKVAREIVRELKKVDR